MAKIFLTGATGFIGGTVLSLLAKSHPEYVIRALVRDEAKGKLVTDAYPNVAIVQGDLDSVDVLASEVSNAEVVIHLASAGHLKSVETIHNALASRPADGKPVHWIQISGASALAAGELADKNRAPGTGSDLVFDDLGGVADIRSHIKRYPARAVDNYILKVAAEDKGINTALVLPPIIYGQGSGPANTRSVQVGKGLNRWGDVHVQDIGRLIATLAEKAGEAKGEEQVWNENGLYLAGVGEKPFGEISKLVAAAAKEKGLIPTDDVEELGPQDSDRVLPHGTVIFGTNARGRARRAEEVLGWKPKGESLEDEIPKSVDREASDLKGSP
ncbi:Uncharacterized protein Cob_v000061 [Colletotrichum orbiculare MAFF 240422]|uniref:NmrA-like domain-containing protein n=1 Tax=Colletotrichum orbiculare (strain 104-T / ATCC 96160 / CBS 514.97 / LARS 414 / MAFF 240422) TaxID=1213857 RepID=A0A484G842_COLOR|nr:Uncharacterized protein Cob_v000061 [Colletotrichum orbiculare MAFF 240422]